MRPDMPDLLVLRPRHSWAAAEHKRAHRRHTNDPRTFADAPAHESPRRHYRNKQLSENFAPLLRFLRGNVGVAFDDVYSALRACLRVDRACDLHVVMHLNDFLIRCTWRGDDGALFGHQRRGPVRLDDVARFSRFGQFYVDPDGVLREQRRAPRVHRRPPPAVASPLVVKGSEALLRVDGRYHHVVFERLDVPLERFGQRRRQRVGACDIEDNGPFDVVLHRPIAHITPNEAQRVYGRVTRYARAIGPVAGAADRRRFGVGAP